MGVQGGYPSRPRSGIHLIVEIISRLRADIVRYSVPIAFRDLVYTLLDLVSPSFTLVSSSFYYSLLPSTYPVFISYAHSSVDGIVTTRFYLFHPSCSLIDLFSMHAPQNPSLRRTRLKLLPTVVSVSRALLFTLFWYIHLAGTVVVICTL
jgi:hypothetical protein